MLGVNSGLSVHQRLEPQGVVNGCFFSRRQPEQECEDRGAPNASKKVVPHFLTRKLVAKERAHFDQERA